MDRSNEEHCVTHFDRSIAGQLLPSVIIAFGYVLVGGSFLFIDRAGVVHVGWGGKLPILLWLVFTLYLQSNYQLQTLIVLISLNL